MTPFLERLKTWWTEADRTQRTVSVVGSAFLVLLLVGVFYFSSRPQMAILFADLSPTQLAAVQTELDKSGVRYEIDRTRTVHVPRNQVTQLQAKLAAAGIAPDIQKFGYGDLADIGMMNSPLVEGTKINAIHEGVLANMIQSLDAIDEAVVKISPMDDSPFAVDRRPATASVVVRERAGHGATSDLGVVIAGMMANAVQGLSRESVTVTTTEGRLLFDGQNAAGGNARVAEKIEAQRDEAERRRRELQQQLDVAFGRGATVVQLWVEMDFDKANITQETRTPSDLPLRSDRVREDLRGASGGPVGVTGLEANVPGAAPAGAQEGTDYTSVQEQKIFGENVTREVREAVPGSVTAMSINVLADTARIGDVAGQRALQEAVRGYLGPKQADPNFTASVNFVPFDQSQAELAQQMAQERASQDQMRQLFSLLPIAALVFVGLMLAMSLRKLGGGRATPSQRDEEYGPNSPSLPPSGGDGQPSPAILDAIEQVGSEGPALPSTEDGEDEEDIELVPLELGSRKVSKPLQQIFHLSDQKPEEVANLVKAWMREEVR